MYEKINKTFTYWASPASDTEKDHQDRSWRMVKNALEENADLDCWYSVYAKGSYGNNTNIRGESDVDIVVLLEDFFQFETAPGVIRHNSSPYTGKWNYDKLKFEVLSSLKNKFSYQNIEQGDIAIKVLSNSGRVDIDVVPSLQYRYYTSSTKYIEGTKVFKADGTAIINYPELQKINGENKNVATHYFYKKIVRIFKSINSLQPNPLPSYFIECVVYNVPDVYFLLKDDLHSKVIEVLEYIIENYSLYKNWTEVNEVKELFTKEVKWDISDVPKLSQFIMNYLKENNE